MSWPRIGESQTLCASNAASVMNNLSQLRQLWNNTGPQRQIFAQLFVSLSELLITARASSCARPNVNPPPPTPSRHLVFGLLACCTHKNFRPCSTVFFMWYSAESKLFSTLGFHNLVVVSASCFFVVVALWWYLWICCHIYFVSFSNLWCSGSVLLIFLKTTILNHMASILWICHCLFFLHLFHLSQYSPMSLTLLM